jgi:hypothetical protein
MTLDDFLGTELNWSRAGWRGVSVDRLTARQVEQLANGTIEVLTTGRIGPDIPSGFHLVDSAQTSRIGAAYYCRRSGPYGHDEVVCAAEFHDGSWRTVGLSREGMNEPPYTDTSAGISHLGSGGFFLKWRPIGTMFYQKFHLPGSAQQILIDGECRPSSESGPIIAIWVEEGRRSSRPSRSPVVTLA